MPNSLSNLTYFHGTSPAIIDSGPLISSLNGTVGGIAVSELFERGRPRLFSFRPIRVVVISYPKEKTVARRFPDSMYVDIPTLACAGGGIAFIVAVFSLAVFAFTGFVMINPIISVLVAIGAATFFFEGKLLRRGQHNGRNG